MNHPTRPQPAGLHRLGLGLLIGAAAWLAAPCALAQPVVLHATTGHEAGVATPLALGADHLLHGTYTGNGRDKAKAAAFRLRPDGQFEVLHTFSGRYGSFPGGLTLGADGRFRGVTMWGGEADWGTVFRLGADGHFKTQHSFTGAPADGRAPDHRLVLASDGFFYGTAPLGGLHDLGTVFRLQPNGRVEVVHHFQGGAQDGASPVGGLTEGSDGFFYGVTGGGGERGKGTLFKMSRDGEVTVLHSFWFDGRDGRPVAPPTEGPDGRFYGVAGGHRENRRGLIFRIDRDGAYEVVYGFPPPLDANGREPRARLTLGRDGAFYGTTSEGGLHGGGTLFRFTTDGVLTTLHHFDAHSAVGAVAGELLETADGEFVGVTGSGGSMGYGSIFCFQAPAR
ncbi:MAG: choice-of-anchor tandem repeat GloVer-containing protein [Burkholderiaceae bacterium]